MKFPTAFHAIVITAVSIGANTIAHSQAMQYDVTSLNGGYAYSISGSATDPGNGWLTRIAEAGRLTADGAGNINGVDTVIIAGSLIRRNVTGTYTINPDGTGSLVLNPSWGPQIHADFTAASAGRILTLMLTDSGSTLSGTMAAQQPAGQTAPAPGYSAAALNGTYVYRLAGSAVDFYGNVTPIREVGRLTPDGAGNITGSSTVSIGGYLVKRTLSGIYTVNPDGSGSATLYPSWGPPIDLDLFLSSNGQSVEFVVTDAGSTLSGLMTADNPPAPANAAVM
jgi:hypothetical protein